MAVDTVTLGQNVTFQTSFINDDGSPFAGTSQATWQIRDHDNNLVTAGTASQNPSTPEQWSFTVVIPTSAPISPAGKRYAVHWAIRNDKFTQRQTDHFSVRFAVDFDIVELDRLALERSPLVDSLALSLDGDLTNATIRLMLESGQEIFNSGALTPGAALSNAIITAERRVHTYASPSAIEGMTVDNSMFRPFIIEWAHNGYGGVEREFHFLYVVTPRAMYFVHNLRKMIDKAQRVHPNPALNYTDVDLIAYLDQGMQYVNFSKPTLTNFTISTLPNVLDMGLLNAAAYCALSAQYLAEGQAAFSFSGQAVSLEIDRTQFIDGALGRIQQFLENQLPTAKRLWLRSTGGNGQAGGVLGVNVGPSIGWSGFGWRYDRYRRTLMGL